MPEHAEASESHRLRPWVFGLEFALIVVTVALAITGLMLNRPATADCGSQDPSC